MVYKALKHLVAKAFPKFSFKLKWDLESNKALFLPPGESK
jgi:hypothetical protein